MSIYLSALEGILAVALDAGLDRRYPIYMLAGSYGIDCMLRSALHAFGGDPDVTVAEKGPVLDW